MSFTTQQSQTTEEATDIIPGQHIVVFKDQAGGIINEQAAQVAEERTNSILADHSISADSVLFQYKYALKGFSAKLSQKQRKALQNDPRVDHVSKAKVLKAGIVGSKSNNPTTSSRSDITTMNSETLPWGVTRVGGQYDGTSRTAWIIDHGIDLDHPDLNVDVQNSASFIANESADDGFGHGTYVAGLLAAINNTQGIVGVAAGADVVAINVCEDDGDLECPTPSVINGIDYVANHAAPEDIVNISLWGGTIPDLDDAVVNAANNGIRFTLIAGNGSGDANNSSPGRVEHGNVWTVSAYDDTDTFATSFSNYGNPPIEYGGPGVDLPSLRIGGGSGMGFGPPDSDDGTSYAAPHIAGLLLVMGDEPNFNGTVSNDQDATPDIIASSRPLSPSISSSVQNDHPRLDWSSIPDAQHYEIERHYETGSWSTIATTSNTYYVDQNISSPDLQHVTFPPFDYDNTYTYRVVAVPAVGRESVSSNMEYFVVDCSGPGCTQ